MFNHPARKLLIKDLHLCTKSTEGIWKLTVKVEKSTSINKTIDVKYVWLQGFIEQTAGKENEILIVSDKTGRVKVTNCNTVPGGSAWLTKGKYCSVVGAIIKVSALPEVAAIKLTDLSKNSILPLIWTEEVEDLKYLLTEQAMPKL